jgi:two-component system, OmpR family, sensor histidine kinase SenX3
MRTFVRRTALWLVTVACSVAVIASTDGWGPAVGALAGTGATVWLLRDIARTFVRPLAHVTSQNRTRLAELRDESDLAKRREAALAYTTDGVLIVLENGHVEYANPTARLFLQDRTFELTNRLNQPDLEQLLDRAQRTGQPVAEDVTLWVPGAKPARARAVPLADGASVLLLSDLSESYRLDRMRRDFVANVSHELKTPVAAIRALAETAGTAMSADDFVTAARFIERLGTESGRLAGLVTDLLDLSRVEAGGEMIVSTVDLDALLVEAADSGRIVGEVKDIEIVVHETDVEVSADWSQLAMAVKNLLDNAVRYSDGGKVELGADRRGDWVVITVADQGIGIPADEVSRIFERFYRVDKGRGRATGGTGLGLAIVRHVVENHRGQVSVESELGVGSTFTITLPSNPSIRPREGDAS